MSDLRGHGCVDYVVSVSVFLLVDHDHVIQILNTDWKGLFHVDAWLVLVFRSQIKS